MKRRKIFITGRVQGVGFRPAVYRLARQLGLAGFIFNDTKGVTIELQGDEQKIDEFLQRLQTAPDKPPIAEIKSYDSIDIDIIESDKRFIIKPSDSKGTALSQVTADIATCHDCLRELFDEQDFRFDYPFINCTNCGPRYSIVKTIPYDRLNTTMSVFEMCQRCAGQYNDVTDRRFHAQPVACADCGPKIWLTDRSGKTIKTNDVIAETARLLLAGKIVAIKGIGGFHLAVNALNNEAMLRLRQRKRRDHKPFAMMTDSVEKIKKYAVVDNISEKVLKSPQAPIVLLAKKDNSNIAASVAEGINTFGFMLCYAPLHYLIFKQGIEVLVMTSGNISDEPLICKNDKAIEKLGSVVDAFLMHDREIYRQVDDSVIHLIDNQAVPLRRARGYVPTPIFIEKGSKMDIFAAGSDMKNTFCFLKKNQIICSEHIGDLEDAEVYHHYIESVEHLRRLFEVEPKVAVCDLHPGYLSTRYAMSLPNVKIIQVQHHWAHIASVLVECGLGGPIIGIECDGTGYGTDGAIWGCECMIATLDRFERFGHLTYYPLPGADKASKEAIRPLLSLLMKAYGQEFKLSKLTWLLEQVEADCHSCESRNPETKKGIDSRPRLWSRTSLRGNDNIRKSKFIVEQIEKGINTVQTSSLGRVFDAVAAMLGLGSYNYFDAQLPMALEAIAATALGDYYDYEITNKDGQAHQLDLSKMFRQIVSDIQIGRDESIISAKFHNTIAAGLLDLAKAARDKSKINTVALSGGVFCNRYLTNKLISLLRQNSFKVLFNREVPANDGGLSIGQAAIAAKLVNRGLSLAPYNW